MKSLREFVRDEFILRRGLAASISNRITQQLQECRDDEHLDQTISQEQMNNQDNNNEDNHDDSNVNDWHDTIMNIPQIRI